MPRWTELDILRSIFTVITKVWGFNLDKNPMDGVRRPKYFNERERRISPDEEMLLIEALAQLDLSVPWRNACKNWPAERSKLQGCLLELQKKRREQSAQFTPVHPAIQVLDAQISAISKEIAGLTGKVKTLPNRSAGC